MNSEKPQNPNSDFPETFDSDEMEINVTYEEISPEEQLKIKQKISEAPPSFDDDSETIVDIWLEDETAVVTTKQEASLVDEEITSHRDLENEIADNLEAQEEVTPPSLVDDVITSSMNLENESIDNKDIEEDILPSSLVDEAVTSPSNLESEITDTLDVKEDILPSSLVDEAVTSPSNLENEITDTLDIEEDIVPSSLVDEAVTSPSNLENEITDNSYLQKTEPEEELTQSENQISLDSETEINPVDSLDLEPEQLLTEEASPKTELIADSWLDESENFTSSLTEKKQQKKELSSAIKALEKQKADLLQEIKTLQTEKEQAIAKQSQELSKNLISMIEEGTRELKERKNNLLVDLEKLERRRERIRQEMQTTFAGASQDLAVRIQGFKEYLVGSLQDLATAAERLELPKPEDRRRVSQREVRTTREDKTVRSSSPVNAQPQFTEQAFAEQTRRIRQLLEQYRTQPDYYGAPWQLRRTFEPIHAEKVQEWFFGQGGRGAIKGMGSRLQNILVASAVISVLYRLYRDRCRVLVLVDTPEKLGEWRRGLCDCLGISRNDFGANRGVVLFESADVLVQRADRLLEDKLLPLIIIDETEELINLGLLKFPLWLAFAEKPQSKSSGYLY